MKNTTLHMIGNAHLDPVWLWRWQEGFQAAKATFRSVLDRMNESDDFVFTSSSAAIYEWIENNDPRMFAEIQERVRAGRWEIVGGWWLQPDCNIPSGESFVRHGLYGQRYFKAKFGVTATIGYNVDSFGHSATLPQILQRSGMDYYIFMRPGPHEKGLPSRVFWWEADDGSRVLAYRIPFEYCTWGAALEKQARRFFSELKPPIDTLMCFYGVGNHGGGPTKANIASIRQMDQDPTFPNMVFSTPGRYFAEITAKQLAFPVVHDELQHHASGCYAAHSGIKRWNRQAENLLLSAEKFSVIALYATGQPYPQALTQAWKHVLFNQFHDILGGTSLAAAYEDARDLYGEAMAIASRSLNYAIQSLAWNIDIPFAEGMTPIVVFNPHAWPAKLSVEVDIGNLTDDDVLIDDLGQSVPMQTVRPPLLVTGWRKRIGFVADLPALGYRVYQVRATPMDRPPATKALLQARASITDAEATTLENAYVRLSLDPVSGHITSIYDKRHNVEVLSAPARPIVIADPSDTWSHGVHQFHNEVGVFRATKLRWVEQGPVKNVIQVTSSYGASTLVQEFGIYHDLDLIEVRVTVDWHEQWKILKLAFPVNVQFYRATYEIPYGHIERATNGDEEAGQNWLDVSGEARTVGIPYGLSLLNDGKYSFDVRGSEMSLTVLRSPIYAHHDPAVPDPAASYNFMDQGVQHFTYTLLPHAGSWEQADTVRRAAELNAPAVALVETYHTGELPQQASYLFAEPSNIVVSVVKRAEDNDDLIIRAYETTNTATHARIGLPRWNRNIEADFGPCEIKTFRIPADATQPTSETNMLEWSD